MSLSLIVLVLGCLVLVLVLGLECLVLVLVLGLEGQVLVNITAKNCQKLMMNWITVEIYMTRGE